MERSEKLGLLCLACSGSWLLILEGSQLVAHLL